MIYEKELEDFIYDALVKDSNEISERGLPMPDSPTFYRQVKLGDYGVVDILGIGRDKDTDKLEVFLYELKRDTVGSSHLPQLCKYLGGIQDWLERNDYSEDYVTYGFLIAPKVESFLTEFLGNNIHFFSVQFDAFEGIRFKHERYCRYSDYSCESLDIEIPKKRSRKRPKKQLAVK